ncbi:hypothetical protein CR194_18060 [Salipaludibacillus keqinensis]|uniref:GerMN domain-containing protein n=1 Tax=Salipaludibacillus keqinensis TaxID=2045207 RepID=A0A323TB12_9BACI|nr:hypothetical protein [Salipaludibacillus keqinensis]PYZ92096.1 hypothetical protein CR194_18060 [Salipaludibacillus keqinensis]
MSDEKWDESKIEKTLTKLPPIKDKQSKDDLFKAIEKRSQQEAPTRYTPKQKRPWVFPAMAAAAAIFLIMLIVPPFFNNSTQFSSDDNSSMDMDTDVVDNAEFEEESNDAESEVSEVEENETSEIESYNNESDNDEVMTEDDSGNDSNNEVEADIGVNTEEELETETSEESQQQITYAESYYTAKSQTIDLGESVTEYVLIQVQESLDEKPMEEVLFTSIVESDPTSGQYLGDIQEVRVEGKEVILDFLEGHGLESLSSTESRILQDVFLELFPIYGFEKVTFMVEGEPGMMFGQEGEVETITLSELNRGYYVTSSSDNEEHYLVSARLAGEETRDESGTPLTFAQTVMRMTSPDVEAGWYESAIPSTVMITNVQIPGDTAEVYYTNSEDDGLVDEEKWFLFIEALKLTAEPFTLDSMQIINEETGDVLEIDLAREMDE